MKSTYTNLLRRHKSIRTTLTSAVLGSIIGLVGAIPQWTMAAELPDGTKLGITAGVGSTPNVACLTGSCFGMEVAPGFEVWTDFEPGTDGGFILGKNQKSGGQETGPSSSKTTSGELTAAWLFFGNYGTFYTVPGGDTNLFDDADCAGATCIGKTELKVWYTAWNGDIIPMGSAAGCTHGNCSDDQRDGIFTSSYAVTNTTGGAWNLEHKQVVPSGGFTGVKYHLYLRGVVTPAPVTLASLSADKTVVVVGGTVTLTGTCSITSGGATVSTCLISQSGGPATANTQAPTGTSTSLTRIDTFTPTTNGTYTFTLTNTASDSTTDASPVTIIVKAADVPFQPSSSGCSVTEGTTVTPSERFDWLLVMAFIVWLGAISRRHRRQQVRI